MVMLEENNTNGDGDAAPKILHRVVKAASSSAAPLRHLRWLMLACEDKPPYGPSQHTGNLFLELITRCLGECISENHREEEGDSCGWEVSIAIYRASQGEYPKSAEEWDSYDGILVPGSLSAAYDCDPWIERLKRVIQEEIVAKERPTLGICFGHQILAHSYNNVVVVGGGGGLAQKYKPGSRGGRYTMLTSNAGAKLFDGMDSVNLFYSHGDMVAKLPPCAVALGMEENGLPCQSAAYFKDQDTKEQFLSVSTSQAKPIAITFQAHPEYAASRELGLQFTVQRILDLLEKKDLISSDFRKNAGKDAEESYDLVQRQSRDVFIASAKALGIFP